jgi:hypothetical protein
MGMLTFCMEVVLNATTTAVNVVVLGDIGTCSVLEPIEKLVEMPRGTCPSVMNDQLADTACVSKLASMAACSIRVALGAEGSREDGCAAIVSPKLPGSEGEEALGRNSSSCVRCVCWLLETSGMAQPSSVTARTILSRIVLPGCLGEKILFGRGSVHEYVVKLGYIFVIYLSKYGRAFHVSSVDTCE